MKENLEILNNINQFYDSAWNKLIIVGTVAFAIVGIVVPLIIQWYQKKSMLLSEKRLKNELDNDVERIKESLRSEMKSILNSEIKKYENKIELLQYGQDARIYHIQGTNAIDKKNYISATQNLISAAEYYHKSEDHNNLQTVLEAIETACLDKISKKDYEEMKDIDKADLEKVIEQILKTDPKGAFKRITNKIKTKLKKLE